MRQPIDMHSIYFRVFFFEKLLFIQMQARCMTLCLLIRLLRNAAVYFFV